MFFDDIIFNMNDTHDTNLFSAKEGFLHGNMFKDEYVPYKNYNISRLESSTDKGNLLLKIYEYDFAINDLSLYLDLHPEDNKVYELFKKYTEEERALVDTYEKLYGPLELDDSPYNNYMWDKGPWPFAGGSF